jgi:hypothetical protein
MKTEAPETSKRIRMNKPSAKTVLFFDHTAKMGGGEISLFHLVQRLNSERYFPVVLLGAEGELRQKLKDCGIETHVLPLSENVANTRKDSLGHSSLLRLGALCELCVMLFGWPGSSKTQSRFHTHEFAQS